MDGLENGTSIYKWMIQEYPPILGNLHMDGKNEYNELMRDQWIIMGSEWNMMGSMGVQWKNQGLVDCNGI